MYYEDTENKTLELHNLCWTGIAMLQFLLTAEQSWFFFFALTTHTT